MYNNCKHATTSTKVTINAKLFFFFSKYTNKHCRIHSAHVECIMINFFENLVSIKRCESNQERFSGLISVLVILVPSILIYIYFSVHTR